MFAEKTGELCSTTGTAAYSMGGAFGSFRTWREGFEDGETAFYLATDAEGTIWEIGYGTFERGTPDTLSRNLIASSSSALIFWATTPYRIYNIPTATALKHMLSPLADGRPDWLPDGAAWLDTDLGIDVAWIAKRLAGGTVDIEEGRHYISDGIFSASQRRKSVDIGAANHTLSANDIGKQLDFNCAAASRSLLGIAHTAEGIGEGFYVFVRPYGSSTNGVTFVPAGSESSTLLSLPPSIVTRLSWDGASGRWVADYIPPAAPVVPRAYLSGLTLSTAGGTSTFGIAVGMAATISNTGDMMVLGAAYTKGTGAWAVGSGNGSLDTGSIASSTWYHVHLIKRPDTGVVDVLISLSPDAPTLPANYTLRHRIGSMLTDGSKHWVAFVQDGDYFRWVSAVLDIDVTNPGNSAATRTLSVPTGINVHAIVNLMVIQSTSTVLVYLSDPSADDETPSTTAAPLASLYPSSGASGAAAQVTVRTNTSAQIRSRCSNAGSAEVLRIATLGWIDRRVRDS